MENLIADIKQKGIGSMFALADTSITDKKQYSNTFYPKNHKLFYTGRHAIKFVIENVAKDRLIPTIWIPEYYCQHVTRWMKRNYSNIKVYAVDPKNRKEVIHTDAFAEDGDLVMINNFWGVHACNIKKGNKDVTILEDHSHGWLTPSCINSKADYCVSSLRKSIPAPLGAMAWKPIGEPMKDIPSKGNTLFLKIWDTITLAQQFKTSYQEADNPDLEDKQKSLALINEAEREMNNNLDLVTLSGDHKNVIRKYIEIDYFEYKKKNLSFLKTLINPSKNYEIVAPKETTFGLTLFIKDHSKMLALRSYLIANTIYPSLLWPDNPTSYGYYLNIHVDFRYGTMEMKYIAEKLNSYIF
ncbi:hypothetical protein [Ascidiimonas sp. W6]|uniref:hypothetical protein n=1 Tax=Ascidiimonas meishanensis TaxID=3128903 RepID=UPI0030EB6E93